MDIGTIMKIIIIIIGLIVGVQVLTSISTSPLGDCANTDYDGDGVVNATLDQATAGFKTCDSSINAGFNILQIASSLLILLIIPVIYMFLGTRREE